MRRVSFQVACIVALAVASTVAADPPANWPRFRGLDAGVVAQPATAKASEASNGAATRRRTGSEVGALNRFDMNASY